MARMTPDPVQNPSTRSSHGPGAPAGGGRGGDARASLRIAAAGLSVNIAFAAAKLIAGIVGHSNALIADAVESLADVLGSVIVVGGIRFAARPPDENHPYGHGKGEALAGLVVAVLLVAAGAAVAVQSIHALLAPAVTPAAWTLLVLVVVIGVKETMFQVARRRALKSASSALLVDAWHHRADAITSVAALVGIALALYAGPAFDHADAWAALAAAGVIIVNGLLLLREPVHELTDAAPDTLIDDVRRAASGVPGVRLVEKVLARKSGSRYLVDMHLHVDGSLSVREAHAIGGRAKAAIRASLPSVADVLVHVEPAE